MRLRLFVIVILILILLALFIALHLRSDPERRVEEIKDSISELSIIVQDISCKENRQSADDLFVYEEITNREFRALIGNKITCNEAMQKIVKGSVLNIIIDSRSDIIMQMKVSGETLIFLDDYLFEAYDTVKYSHYMALVFILCLLIQFREDWNRMKAEKKY